MRSGKSQKTGNPWMSLIFEDTDASQVEVSVPQDMQSEVYGSNLQKGSHYDLPIRAAARADGNSYIQLLGMPEFVADVNGEVGY